MTTKIVNVKTRIRGFHHWPAAPDDVIFLANKHRHIFYVQLAVEVQDTDRQVEFITLQGELNEFIHGRWFEGSTGHGIDFGTMSCEMIAQEIYDHFNDPSKAGYDVAWVCVSEDDENEAWVCGNLVKNNPPPAKMTMDFSGPQTSLFTLDGKDVPNFNPDLLPSRQLRMKCFIGTEAEGPYAGRLTFFVPASVRPGEFLKAWAACQGREEVKAIYYGAGNDRRFRSDTYYAVFKMASDYEIPVVVEVDKLGDLTVPVFEQKVTFVSYDPRDLRRVDYVKTVHDRKVNWYSSDGTVVTTAEDAPAYAHDKEIE